MNAFEPAKTNQLGNAARVVAVGLDAHGREGCSDMPRFHDGNGEAFTDKPLMKPLREIAGLKADMFDASALVPDRLRNRSWFAFGTCFLDDAAALVDDTDVCLIQRHIEAHEEFHSMYSLFSNEAGNCPNVAVWRKARSAHLNRQAVVMARHGVPIDRSVLADWMGRTGALIAPVVDHMAKRLKADSTRLYVDETTAPVLDPGKGKTKTGYLWAVLRDDRGWGGTAPPGVVFHYRPGRKGEYAAEILEGFNGTIQVDAYGGYTHLATPKRTGGKPLQLAFCWAHGRRKLIKAKPQKGSPIVDEALLRIAALYKLEDAIRGSDPDHRRAVRQEMSRPLVDEFFTWLKAQAARVSRKSDLGEAMAYMLKRQDGFRLFLDDGHVDIDSNLVENAIRSPAMNRRNALFAGHDEGGKNWARFASLIGSCKMIGVEPYAYLRDLFTKLANGHLDKDIDALMPWAYPRQTEGS